MRAPPPSRQARRRGVVIAVIVLLLILAAASSRFYTDVLWFQEVGFTSVLLNSLRAQFLLGLIVGVVVAILIWVNLTLASRARPTYRPAPRIEGAVRIDPLDRYRDQLGPYVRVLRIALAIGIGFLAGASASSGWRTFLLWINRVDFEVADPQFGLDIGFYVFELPFLNFVLSWLWFAFMVSLLATLAAYYFFGSIRPEGGLAGVEAGALAHISVLLGFLALIKAGQYWLGRYGLNFSERGVVHGASYTDVHAHLPALTLLAMISLISAGLFLVNIRYRRTSLPLAAVGIWIGVSVLAGGVWPFLVQRFSVEPQELQREREFIDRNIEATREGFGLADVQPQSFAAQSVVSSESVERNGALLSNVRLWDPLELQQAYSQIQALRTYYRFEDVDVDRYEVGGQLRQVLLSARELSVEDLQDRTWANEHLAFTHGFGIVASLANEATDSGQPSFLVRDVPGTVAPEATSLDIDQPRLYYGEAFAADEYSIVDTQQEEVDYPVGEDVRRGSYAGSGGVSLGNPLSRVAFALRENDPNLILSGLITGDSQILIYRNVRERVRRAAPFLALDNDPYPAVVDGRLMWILDAYTSTPYYPYAQRFSLDQLLGAGGSGALSGTANYVRNSVKVVVDAYNGTMKLYVIDEGDPLIRAWRNAFPNLFTREAPSEELRAHFRYPEDMFRIQSHVYRTYHMTKPETFYLKEDAWQVPAAEEVTGSQLRSTPVGEIDPTYLLIQLPGETEQEFVLTRPFTPATKNNMIAFMAGRSDPEQYGELISLRFPSQSAVLGPAQVDNLINQDVEIAQALTLLGQRGSAVSFGSLVILPIEESILYIQPLFVQAQSGGIPELKKVILVAGEEVVMGDSFDQALSDLFGVGGPAPTPPPGEGGPEPPPPGGPSAERLQELVAEAGRVYREAQRALADGDFETYGRLIEELGSLIEQAEQLSSSGNPPP
jgi:uncharacterized membrane protein (UPF0182 family)